VPDREAFLRMICDHPREYGPRLVFADWLEEQGDTARAEFIRLQCERALLPREEIEKRQRLTARCDELYQPRRDNWRLELPALPGVTWGVYQRGFVHNVRLENSAAFLLHAKAMFAAAPIEEVWFSTLGIDGARALATSPLLARVATLKIDNTQLGNEGIAAVIGSPHLANVERLLAGGNSISHDGASSIANSIYLKNLRMLFLSSNQIGDKGAEAIGQSKCLPLVEEVYAAANGLHESGIAALRHRWGDKAHV
jgi:uncharacterized protein (TIGR02996 family)